MDGFGILMFVLVVFVVTIIFGGISKRRAEFDALARRLGLNYRAGKDHSLANRFGFLHARALGSRRYAFDVLSGVYQGHEVLLFDYYYQTHSTDSKGRRQTHRHCVSFFILMLTRSFPELRITREGLFSRIARRDKRFAYGVHHAQMLDYLLAHCVLSIEIEGTALALAFDKRLSVEEIKSNLARLIEIGLRLPEFLFDRVA